MCGQKEAGPTERERKDRIETELEGTENARFLTMDADRILFPDGFFDIVTCRHSVIHAPELARLLKKGDLFISQQVGEGDKLNIKEWFGRGQSYGIADGSSMRENVQALKAAGFSNVETREYNAIEYYQTPEDLLFLLKHTPIIPDLGEHEDDFARFQSFVAENTTAKGIRTNSKRYLIIAYK